MSKFLYSLVNRLIIVLSKYKDRNERESYIAGIKNSYDKLTRKKDLTNEQKRDIQ